MGPGNSGGARSPRRLCASDGGDERRPRWQEHYSSPWSRSEERAPRPLVEGPKPSATAQQAGALPLS
eukprot:10359456-Alexandrium_andersonii.AAC.1